MEIIPLIESDGVRNQEIGNILEYFRYPNK